MIKLRTSLVVLVVALAAVCGSNSQAADTAPLRVGVTPVFPPVIYKEDGKIIGVEADLARVLGAELGRPVQFVELDWEDQIPALTEGRTDIIMSGMSITPARQLRITFAKPYLVTGQMALVRREDAYRYALGFPSRPEGPVGVVRATTGDFLVQQEFPNIKRKEYSSSEAAAKALMKKRVNLFICDAPTIWWLAGLHEADGLVGVPFLLSQEQLAWGVTRANTDLLDQVNRAQDKLQQEGQISRIVKRWIPLFK
jgi:ABC-type amino acid transport substrate-binding protein